MKALLKAVIAVVVIVLAVAGVFIVHVGHTSAYVVVHRGQPLPRHYVEAWSFGNYTIVEVEPSSTTVTLAPWS